MTGFVRRSIFAAVSSTLIAIPAPAQQRLALSAEGVARAFFEAMGRGAWSEAATYVDQEPLDNLRWVLLSQARHAAENRPPVNPQDLMRGDSTMTLSEATIRAQALTLSMSHQRPLWTYEFRTIRDTVELAALSPVELAARWLEGEDPRYPMLVAIAKGNCRDTVKAAVRAQTLATFPRTLEGVVVRDTVAYAIARNPARVISSGLSLPVVRANLLILSRHSDGWKVMPHLNLFDASVSVGPMTCRGP